MTRKVAPLTTLAHLVLDHRLQQLRAVGEALDRSRQQLQALDVPGAQGDLPPVAAALVDVSYRRWADVRRGELNMLLARQTAEMIEAKARAAQAFGRFQALQGVEERLAGRK